MTAAAIANLPTARQLSPVEQFKMQVLPPDKIGELRASLPQHIRPELFERNLLNAIMQNPKLMKCDPRLVYREVSKAAALGLLLDPQLGEAYIIVGWNGKQQREEPQFRAGYRGLVKLARQSNEVSIIYAHEVCANDEIDCALGDQKKLVHKPNLFGDRGEVIGYYAVCRYKDGSTDFEPMTKAQVDAIRERSDGYKAFKNGKIKSTPWGTDYDEMAKKTAIRRLCKRTPMSPDLADAFRHEDRADGEMRDVTPAKAAAATVQDALSGPTEAQQIEHSGDQDGVERSGADAGETEHGGPELEGSAEETGEVSFLPPRPADPAGWPEWSKQAKALIAEASAEQMAAIEHELANPEPSAPEAPDVFKGEIARAMKARWMAVKKEPK